MHRLDEVEDAGAVEIGKMVVQQDAVEGILADDIECLGGAFRLAQRYIEARFVEHAAQRHAVDVFVVDDENAELLRNVD